MQIRTAGGLEGLLGFLPGAALDERVRQGQARLRVGERAHVRQQARVQPGLAAGDELRVHAQPFAHLEAGRRRPLGQFVDLRPGAFGVDVVDGEGDTPPQSSIPAPISRSYSLSTRFGGAWMLAAGPMMWRATATVATSSSSSASGMPRIAVSGLARKFWMISSWTPW